MNFIEKKKRAMGQGGFTLIELLVVIAILAVLAGLAVLGIGAMRTNAEKTACKADKDTVETAARAWMLDDANSAATLNIAALTGGADPYLKKEPNTKFGITVSASGGNPVVSSTYAGC